MSFWDDLKKKAEGIIAQVNPVDGGKTYASVVNNRQPVRTVAQPRPTVTSPRGVRSPAVSITPAKPKPVSMSMPSVLKVPTLKTPAMQQPKMAPAPKPAITQPTKTITAPTRQMTPQVMQRPQRQAVPQIITRPQRQNPVMPTVNNKPLSLAAPQPAVPKPIVSMGPIKNDDYSKPPTIDTRISTIKKGIAAKMPLDTISKKSGLSKQELLDYTSKNANRYGHDNLAQSAGNLVVDMTRKAVGVATRGGATLATELNPEVGKRLNLELTILDKRYKSGQISLGKLREEAKKVTADPISGEDIIGSPVMIDERGISRATAQEQAKRATLGGLEQGIDTAGVLPVGRGIAGIKAAGSGLTKVATKDILTTNAKQALVYGSTSTGNDVAQGRGVTPESLAINFGAPFALGAGSEFAGVASKPMLDAVKRIPKDIKDKALIQAADGSRPLDVPTSKLISYEGAPDRARVEEYKARMQNGGDIEPLYAMPDHTGRLSVEDGKHRLQAATELGRERLPVYVVTPARMKAVMQGGYAKIPGSNGKNIIDDTPDGLRRDFDIQQEANRVNTPEDYKNEIVDTIWKNNKKGAGTEVVTKETDYGLGGQEMTRVSNNTPFYRAFYEEYGHKPTHREITKLVDDYFDGADNIIRHEVMPEQRAAFDMVNERHTAQTQITTDERSFMNDLREAEIPDTTKAQMIRDYKAKDDPAITQPVARAATEQQPQLQKQVELDRIPDSADSSYSVSNRDIDNQNTQPTTTRRLTREEFEQLRGPLEDNITDPTPISQVIKDKEARVGEQFAKPQKSFDRTQGRIDTETQGVILSESRSGLQRRRLLRNSKSGVAEVLVETRNPNGSWTKDLEREPAIAHPGDFRGIDKIEESADLNKAAMKAMEDGKEIHFFAAKQTGDPNNLSAEVIRFDPEKHIIDGGFVRDADTNTLLGNHIKVDSTGIQISIGKKVVNMDSVVGDASKWRNMNKTTYTMDRMLEAAAPNQAVYKATRRFVVEKKIASEAKMRTDLAQYRNDIKKWRDDLLLTKPSGMKKKDFLTDVFYFAEKKLAQSPEMKGKKLTQEGILNAKYGTTTTKKIKEFDSWAREQYDSLLDRTNEVLREFGHDEVPKRQNYMTHLQEDSFWDQIGIGEDLYRDLSSGISGEANPTNRGQLPGTIAGRTEQFKPTKKYNPFHQVRRGKDSMTDPFKAMDAYGEAALFNIHMTEPAVRARSLEAVFRTAEEVVNKDMLKQVNEDLRKSLKESMQGSRGDLVVAFQEYANTLAGKSNSFDRVLQDKGGVGGRTALRLSRLLQKVASNSSIIGNASVTVAQALNIPNVIGTNGGRAYLRGVGRMINDIGLNGEPKPGSPASKSDFLKVRYTDAQSRINATKMQIVNRGMSKALFMVQAERAFTEMAWESSYSKALMKGLKGLPAVKEADRVTERLVAGRGIGDQPEIYRSTIGRTFLQYTLEVNAALKNVRNDMSPLGVIKYAAAVFAMNYGIEQLTGRAPLPDFVGAGIDTVGDFADMKSYDDGDDKTSAYDVLGQKAVKAGRRIASESSKLSPVVSAGANTFLSQDARKALFGEDSDLGRYDGSPAAAQVVSKLIQGFGDLVSGDPSKALDKSLAAVPYGSQIRKTVGGITTMIEGVARDSSGSPTAAIDTTNPLTWVKAALFGKNSIPEVKTYYDTKASSLGDKQTETFDNLKAKEGIKSATEYLISVMSRRESNKDDKATGTQDQKDYSAEAKVKISEGEWEERDGTLVNAESGEVVRSYYKKIAKEGIKNKDESDSTYEAILKGYNIKTLGSGKAAKTGDETLDKLSGLSGIANQKDVIDQAISLIKGEGDGKDVPTWAKVRYMNENKINKGDAVYAAKASYENETKIPVVKDEMKGMDHGQVLDYLAKGRMKSIGDAYWVTTGVLANLRDAGVISKQEYTNLNKLKYNSDGTLAVAYGGTGRGKGGSKGGKGGKGKTVSVDEIRAANPTGDIESAIAKIIASAAKVRSPGKISYKKRT